MKLSTGMTMISPSPEVNSSSVSVRAALSLPVAAMAAILGSSSTAGHDRHAKSLNRIQCGERYCRFFDSFDDYRHYLPMFGNNQLTGLHCVLPYNGRARFYSWRTRMGADALLDEDGRIVSNPAICHGNPVIRGTRIMVWLILEHLANGDSVADVLAAYPTLAKEDVFACLAYASKAARERVVPVEIAAHAL